MSASLRDIESARTLRSAALVVADIDPELAQRLHRASQDIWETLAPGRHVIVTLNSVYTVTVDRDGVGFVTGRASFESGFLPPDRSYSGKVVTPMQVGARLTFLDPELGPVHTSTIVEVIKLING